MKVLIAYYSKGGKTEKVAKALEEEFKGKGHSVDLEKVRALKERNQLIWFFIKLFKRETAIQDLKIKDATGYDLVCVGSPNWIGLSLPIARYLKEIKGLKYKNIGFFATTFLPFVEWYILTLYLLDSAFSRIIEGEKARVVDTLFLSNFFKRWSNSSQYGKKAVEKFCSKLETPISSFKDYFLEQKEVESTRFLVILFSLILLISFWFQIISTNLYRPVFTWSEYLFLFSIGFSSYFAMLTILASRTLVFWGKYLMGITLSALLTLFPLFFTFVEGGPIILGYILIFILLSFFRDPRAVIFSGGAAFLGYAFLFFNYPIAGILEPNTDIPLLLISLGMVTYISLRLQKHYISSLEAQDEIEAARKRAEEEKEKTLTIITNFADGLLVFGDRGRLLLVNPQAEKFFNIQPQKIIGKTVLGLSGFSELKTLTKLLGPKVKKLFRQELVLSEELNLEVSTVPMVSGKEQLGTLVILHDVSREKIIERMKTEFVSLAAHQLKTPLSGIKWTLKMFLDKEFGEMTKEQMDYIEKTYNANERMISLINDLLNVARIEEGRYIYKPSPTDFEEVIQGVIDIYQKNLKDKNLKLSFKKPKVRLPSVPTDIEKMTLAVENLVSNAIKYTLKGGTITISFKSDKDELEIAVADTGLGIPKEQQARVFTKFFRGTNVMKKETEGTGLGLFIAQNIIKAHKGKIWFESTEDKGTTFHVSLPVKK